MPLTCRRLSGQPRRGIRRPPAVSATMPTRATSDANRHAELGTDHLVNASPRADELLDLLTAPSAQRPGYGGRTRDVDRTIIPVKRRPLTSPGDGGCSMNTTRLQPRTPGWSDPSGWTPPAVSPAARRSTFPARQHTFQSAADCCWLRRPSLFPKTNGTINAQDAPSGDQPTVNLTVGISVVWLAVSAEPVLLSEVNGLAVPRSAGDHDPGSAQRLRVHADPVRRPPARAVGRARRAPGRRGTFGFAAPPPRLVERHMALHAWRQVNIACNFAD